MIIFLKTISNIFRPWYLRLMAGLLMIAMGNSIFYGFLYCFSSFGNFRGK
jgi:hypothetical protein